MDIKINSLLTPNNYLKKVPEAEKTTSVKETENKEVPVIREVSSEGGSGVVLDKSLFKEVPEDFRIKITTPEEQEAMRIEGQSEFYFRQISMAEKFLEGKENMLKARYTKSPHHDILHTENYATVEVDGKVIAELRNSAVAYVHDDEYAKIVMSMPLYGAGGEQTGPALALARAEYLAQALGGNVIIGEKALSPEEYERLDAVPKEFNRLGMRADPEYRELQAIREKLEARKQEYEVYKETGEPPESIKNGTLEGFSII
jgi:hypothetical protein